MKKTNMKLRESLRFKRFTRKGYGLFSVLGREVLIGTLSIATLSHAKADGISVETELAGETTQRSELNLDEVVVTGTRTPLTQGEAAKIVSVITRDDIHRAAAETINDVLKLATGVDVRQRGGFGIQTDISIGGGTFDQIAILLNGVNISNPQTGHLSADFPVSLDDIERIEVIDGAASRVYGAQAFNGAINIVTTTETGTQDGKYNGSVAIKGGSFGTFGGSARGRLATGSLTNTLSVGYDQSDGGTENNYFRKSQGFYQGRYAPLSQNNIRLSSLSWQFGVSAKRYGANTFYSAAYPNQYESNARLFASIKGDIRLGAFHLQVTPYWNRNLDHFQLIYGSSIGENFHRTDVLGTSANIYTEWKLGRTSVGMEIRKERIYSTNLGTPLDEADYIEVGRHDGIFYKKRCERTDASFFLEHNILLKNFTASFGMVANKNTGYNNSYRLYPGIDVCYRPSGKWKMTASWNMAFRMPTFTDLFYKSPTQEGNVGLNPEKTQSLRLGIHYQHSLLAANASFFYDWGTDMIDWVMYSADDIYHSANFSLDNRGFQVNADLLPREVWHNAYISRIHVGYAYIDQSRKDNVEIYKSNYAMEYLRHKFVAGIDHKIVSNLTASWSFRWQQRMGSYILYNNHKSTGEAHPYHPYGLLDLKLLWTAKRYELSLSMNNLTSYRYYDLGNVEQPGFWLMAGAKFKF